MKEMLFCISCRREEKICNLLYAFAIAIAFERFDASHFSEERESKVHVVQDIYISKYFKELDRAIKLKIHIYH